MIPTDGIKQAVLRIRPLAGSEEAPQFGFFAVEQCCFLWQYYNTVRCPETRQVIRLTDLIPDVLIQDVPVELHITAEELAFEPTPESFIGYGGEAHVYVHNFRNNLAAVKVYHLPSLSGTAMANRAILTESSPLATQLYFLLPVSSIASFHNIDVQFRNERSVAEAAVNRTKAAMYPSSSDPTDEPCSLAALTRGSFILDALSKMRKEVTFLLQLRHPCVVPLVGFCLRPFCLLTEYAPLGSLAVALSKIHDHWTKLVKQKSPTTARTDEAEVLFANAIMGRALTWKIAFQASYSAL